jgi:hypothetical protein
MNKEQMDACVKEVEEKLAGMTKEEFYTALGINKPMSENMNTEIGKLIKRWDESLVGEDEWTELSDLVKLVINDVLFYVYDEVNYEAGNREAKEVDEAIRKHYGLT